MTLWFSLALMTAAAIFAVLWPLGRRLPIEAGGNDAAVYRDQLDELERHRAAGLIGDSDAEAARAEIGRRLIAAVDAAAPACAQQRTARDWPRRAVAVCALAVLPTAAVALYSVLGSPSLPGAPLLARAQTPLTEQPVQNLVVRVEEHLAANPEDGRGWEVLAPVYVRLARFDDAVRARRNALRILGATAAREADLGEALVYAANGVVTEEAHAAFQRGLALDPKHVKARYFIGLAAEQGGRLDEAAAAWRALLADVTQDTAWSELIRASLARLEKAPAGAGPSADDVAAAASMSESERAAMVRGMVDRLAERLKQDGSDVDGWLRLVRAYMVLGEPDSAKAAAANARRAIAPDEAKLRRIDELMKTLGLET